MNFESGNSSKKEHIICQSTEALSFCDNGNNHNTKEPVDSDEEGGFDGLHEIVNQMEAFMKINDFSGILSRFKNLEIYIKELRNEIHPRFYIRFLVELEDCIQEAWNNRKILVKKNLQDLDTVKNKFQKISKISANAMEKYRESLELSDEDGETSESDEYENETESNENSICEDDECADDDSSNMSKTVLPYNDINSSFGSRILEIDSTKLTYEEAYKNPEYVNKALDLNPSNVGIPIEFTQFVLKKMATKSALNCSSFEKALHRKAKEYLLKLIGPQDSEVRQIHPKCPQQRPSIFRSRFVTYFSRKVIQNLQNVNCEIERFDKLARIFPFKIRKDICEFRVKVLKKLDDQFYTKMQRFLNEHFDQKVPARETIALFLYNVHHFFKTRSSKKRSSESLRTLPRLNNKGIAHFQYLYSEYRSVLKHYLRHQVPRLQLHSENEDLRMLPEKNFDELTSLLDANVFVTKPNMYDDIFKKYLFFFVHALQVEEDSTPSVFFIDDMIFQCLLSLRRFRTAREDIKIVFDIAAITLLSLLGQDVYTACDLSNVDRHSMNTATLRSIKKYITTFVSNENTRPNVQFNFGYKTELFGQIPIRVNNTILFNICYATKQYNCIKGIMHFLRLFLSSVLCPRENPIEEIVCYSAFLGQENRFAIPREIVESIRNFVRLSRGFAERKIIT